jgi:hypothetical protein
MTLFNPFQKSLLTLGKRLARKDSCGVATVVYCKKVLVLHISDINRNKSWLLSFEFFSSTFSDATIAVFELSLASTKFVGGLDLANLILLKTCLSATSSSSLFPEGGLGGALPFPFLQILLPIKTIELVTKLIKLQKNGSNTLTLVSTTCVSTTIPPLSSTLRTMIDDLKCAKTEPAIIWQIQ